MASSSQVKAKILSSSSCSMSDAAAFLNKYINGSSTADPMVKGYLQNVVHAIDGMVSQRKASQKDVLPKKRKKSHVEDRVSAQGDGLAGDLHARSNNDVSISAKSLLRLSARSEMAETLSILADSQMNGYVDGTPLRVKKRKEKRSDAAISDLQDSQAAKGRLLLSNEHNMLPVLDVDNDDPRPKKKRRKELLQDEPLGASRDKSEGLSSLANHTKVEGMTESIQEKGGKDSFVKSVTEGFIEQTEDILDKKRRKELGKMRLQSKRES